MKEYFNLIKYHYILYGKTNKFVIPMILYLTILIANYRQKPLDIVSCLVVTAMYNFFILIWIGMTYFDSIDVVLEQIVLFRVSKRMKYYISKYLFLLSVVTILSIFSIIYPIIQNGVNSFGMFTRNITLDDLIFGFIIHFCTGVLGIAVVALFQPLCVPKRKSALLFATMFSVIGLAKDAIVNTYGVLKYVLWVCPPITNILVKFKGLQYFNSLDVLVSLLIAVVYCTVSVIIAQLIIRKKLY